MRTDIGGVDRQETGAGALAEAIQPVLLAPTHGSRWKVRLGMPHLSPSGLSEGWLLRQAGDVHWALLTKRLGVPPRAWRGANGGRVYASFVALEMRGSLPHRVAEGDVLSCTSELRAAGANRHVSRHRLRARGGRLRAVLWLVSAFVQRDGGSNRDFVKSQKDGLAGEPEAAWPAVARLMAMRRRLRQPEGTIGAQAPLHLRVCAMEDFNALDMVYFANFPRLLDRAERQHRFGEEAAMRRIVPAPRLRQCFFYGNADGGDALRATVRREQDALEVRLSHQDGALLCVGHVERPDLGVTGT